MCVSASKNPRFWAMMCFGVWPSSVAASAQDEPWQAMDYGPFLSAAIEVTPDNIACKGIAIPAR